LNGALANSKALASQGRNFEAGGALSGPAAVLLGGAAALRSTIRGLATSTNQTANLAANLERRLALNPDNDFGPVSQTTPLSTPPSAVPSPPNAVGAGARLDVRVAELPRGGVGLVTNAAKTTVLGENMTQRVIPFAAKTNSRTLPFGVSRDAWEAMTPAQRYKLNDAALRTRIGEGDSFRYIGQDAERLPLERKRFDLTRSELLRLEERGIPYETVSPAEVEKVLD